MTTPMTCPRCGSRMNHHAEKVVHLTGDDDATIDPVLGGPVEEVHACPACGACASRLAGTER